MSAASLPKFIYLAYFSNPPSHRALYRSLRLRKPKSIVQIGVGDGVLTRRLLELARRYQSEVQFAGIDLYEARPDGSPQLTLKEAHRTWHALGVRARVIPGDPFSALARQSNSLPKTDLLLVSNDVDPDSLRRAWFYVPRMLHATSLVLCENAQGIYEPQRVEELQRLVGGHRAAA